MKHMSPRVVDWESEKGDLLHDPQRVQISQQTHRVVFKFPEEYKSRVGTWPTGVSELESFER